MAAYTRESLLEDESDVLQLGQITESTFYGFSLSSPKSTSWNKFPTPENPLNMMKYASVDIYVHPEITIWNR